MVNFMRRIFGKNEQVRHDDVMKKSQQVVMGTDPKSQTVHRLKNNYTKELLKISKQAKRVQKESEKLVKIVDTAYHIAKVTGNMR